MRRNFRRVIVVLATSALYKQGLNFRTGNSEVTDTAQKGGLR